MNREIKFKAWHSKVRQIINVYLINQQRHAGLEYCGICRGYYGNNIQVEFFYDEVQWLQYTGLKDINNIDIYEGDVVKCYDHPTNIESATGEVYFSHGCFRVKNSSVILSDYGTAWTEILGNIFSNPELLKQ